jgi:hypothetical protein
MTSTEHGLPNGHQVGDRMVPIANELRSTKSVRNIRATAYSMQVPLANC